MVFPNELRDIFKLQWPWNFAHECVRVINVSLYDFPLIGVKASPFYEEILSFVIGEKGNRITVEIIEFDIEEEEEEEAEIFFIVEDMPSFQGKGQEGFRAWIAKNLRLLSK